ncbi:MAG: outer membrane protein [Oleiphilaceae bacterium]|jgi:outer membrane protein
MKRLPKLLFTSVMSLAAFPALTMGADLLSLYQKAENYDADIFAAKSAYLAEREGESIAFSKLLPSINASASIEHTDSNFKGSPDDSYITETYTVALSQPLINFSSWYKVTAAEQNTLQAETTYLAAQQNLILEISSAYFGVLRTEENLRSAKSQEAAVKRQYEQAKEQFDVGLIAITDVHEAKASYDASQTLRIRSEGDLTIARENLSRITGEYSTELATLKSDFPITMDKNTSAEQWAESAFQNNLNIKIAEFALNSVKADYKASKSGHYPTLNLEAGYRNNDFSNNRSNDTDQTNTNIALTLNVPLYSGGATQASVRQKRHLIEQASQQLTSAQRQAKIETRTEYINLKTNIQTVESLQQNIISRQSALEATREGYNVGTRNIVEVLDAERNYFTALRDYANARFDFVESNLRIKRSAGTLNKADIEALNKWLESR